MTSLITNWTIIYHCVMYMHSPTPRTYQALIGQMCWDNESKNNNNKLLFCYWLQHSQQPIRAWDVLGVGECMYIITWYLISLNEVSFLQNFHPEMLIVIVALPSSNPHDLRKKNILPKSKKTLYKNYYEYHTLQRKCLLVFYIIMACHKIDETSFTNA